MRKWKINGFCSNHATKHGSAFARQAELIANRITTHSYSHNSLVEPNTIITVLCLSEKQKKQHGKGKAISDEHSERECSYVAMCMGTSGSVTFESPFSRSLVLQQLVPSFSLLSSFPPANFIHSPSRLFLHSLSLFSHLPSPSTTPHLTPTRHSQKLAFSPPLHCSVVFPFIVAVLSPL